jgi:transcriptional regulator with XRE-family HTH domain
MRRRKSTRPEWADRLEGLRESLGMSQAALAKKLNVSAMAPSRWERGVHEPPADVFLQLGKLAGKRECWYFWERAGLSRRDVTSVIERATSRRKSNHHVLEVAIPPQLPAKSSEPLLAVPAYDTSLTVGQVGPDAKILHESVSQLVVVPRSWCPNDKTFCLRIGTDRMAPMLRRDTLFAVDPADDSLDNLFGKIVFASHPECGLSVSWLQRFGRSTVLVPENKDDPPYYLNGDDWKIEGRVLWWFSKGP